MELSPDCMPKGLYIDPLMLSRFRAKAVQVTNLPLNSNKSYDEFLEFVVGKTGARVSSITLRRLFQFNSPTLPTKYTLDTLSRSLGFVDWDDFEAKERTLSQYDLSQFISAIQMGGIANPEAIGEQILRFRSCDNLFNLLDVVIQALIAGRHIRELGSLFDLPGLFTVNQDPLKIYFFVHNLVFRLNQAGLMAELTPHYGASAQAQVFLVEWYVDEDHLDGYYYDLLQEYHRHKTNIEAQLFYNCLMYQRAMMKNESLLPWLDHVRNFVQTEPVHPIPRARRLAILLLQSAADSQVSDNLTQEIATFFSNLSEDDRIVTAQIMSRLLYLKRRTDLITFILTFVPDIVGVEKDIWTRININHLRIYRAASYLHSGERERAGNELAQFDSYMVNSFVRSITMADYTYLLAQIEQTS